MFKKRSLQKELMDDLQLDQPLLLQNLNELELTNRWLGSQKTLLIAIERIYQKNKTYFQKEVTITDLGCGNGDLLRAISKWGKAKGLNIKLLGIDANPFMLNIATERSDRFSDISFTQANVFDENFKKSNYDIITLNSFCHHLTENEFSSLLGQLKNQTTLAIIINDLHRHWIPYFFIKIVSKIFNFSHLAKNDGPLSVLRAFTKTELKHYMKISACHNYNIKWSFPFRWQVIIWCNYIDKEMNNGNQH